MKQLPNRVTKVIEDEYEGMHKFYQDPSYQESLANKLN